MAKPRRGPAASVLAQEARADAAARDRLDGAAAALKDDLRAAHEAIRDLRAERAAMAAWMTAQEAELNRAIAQVHADISASSKAIQAETGPYVAALREAQETTLDRMQDEAMRVAACQTPADYAQLMATVTRFVFADELDQARTVVIDAMRESMSGLVKAIAAGEQRGTMLASVLAAFWDTPTAELVNRAARKGRKFTPATLAMVVPAPGAGPAMLRAKADRTIPHDDPTPPAWLRAAADARTFSEMGAALRGDMAEQADTPARPAHRPGREPPESVEHGPAARPRGR